MSRFIPKKRAFINIIAGLVALGSIVLLPSSGASAACQAQATDYGSVSVTLNIPATATYRLWTRMMTPDASNNTYLLEVDGGTCYTVGGGVTPSQWVWVDYQSGVATNKVQLSLNQGNHTLKLIGNKPNVKIDRILAVGDLACTPTGFGDNCNVPADTTPPTVSLTGPAEGATVSGTVNLAATAADTSGIARVEFFDNSVQQGAADTTSPYNASWDTTKVPNGQHLLTVKAYDTYGNIGTDTSVVNVKNGDSQAPSVPGNVKANTTSHSSIQVTWSASTDNTAVTAYTIVRDGVPVANLGAVTSFNDTGLMANTQYAYQVIAADAAGNKSAASAKALATTSTVPDSTAPSKPAGLTATPVSTTQINLAWAASTDNVGVTSYDVYRGKDNDQPVKVGSATTTTFGDTNLTASSTYKYFVVARDGAGNSSQPSDAVSGTTQTPSKQYSSLRGTIRNAENGNRLRHASVVLTVGNNRHVYQANRKGNYAIFRLEATTYSPTYRARGYQPKTISNIKLVADVPYIQNVNLTKK